MVSETSIVLLYVLRVYLRTVESWCDGSRVLCVGYCTCDEAQGSRLSAFLLSSEQF